jgi:predicted oxidoreductase (fatty acid repression mutant protein)
MYNVMRATNKHSNPNQKQIEKIKMKTIVYFTDAKLKEKLQRLLNSKEENFEFNKIVEKLKR